jgi:hypothetical protein
MCVILTVALDLVDVEATARVLDERGTHASAVLALFTVTADVEAHG